MILQAYPVENPPGLVDLHYYPPPERLKECFGPSYLFTADKASISDVTRADFPQLRFMLSGTGDYHFHGGSVMATPEACLLGPTMGATHFEVTGPLQVLGVSVLPLGWVGLGLADASGFADRAVDMDVLGPGVPEFLAAMRGLVDPKDAVAALWDFLAAHVKPAPRSVASFVRTCDMWLAGERSPRVEDLVRAAGLSARQVARHANRLYGAPPKYLARKFRALRCAADIALDHQDWTEMVDGAFYDQSHFIREIKHFIGLTPHQLKTGPSTVARLTLQRRGMVGTVAEINRIS